MVTLKAYLLDGLLVGVGSLLLMGRLNSGVPGAGLSYEMDAITAVVVGGTSMSGGSGTLFGTLVGAMALISAFSLSMLAGCGTNNGGSAGDSSNASFEVGYVNLANTDVFCMSRIEALNAATEGTDFNVSVSDGNNDPQKQVDFAGSFLAKGVDGLVLVPADSEAIVPAVTAANSAKVPVICLGIKANSGEYIYVGSENYEAGYMQGEYMAEILPENAKVLYCAGTAGLQHSVDRRQGFQDALSKAGRKDISILADQDGDYVKDEAMRICDAWIQTYSNSMGGVTFDAIVCANDQMALGCIESLRSAGVLTAAGEILISGVDGTDEAIQAVMDGYMAQTVLQDAPGQAAACVEVLEQIKAGETPGTEIIVPFQSITKDNVADYQ